MGGTLAVGATSARADNDSLDDKLENRVESSYTDAKLGGLDVDVKNGVVTLTGEVASSAERARAERLARTAGARRVVNKLVIDTDKTAARIEDRAEARKEVVDEKAERQKDAIDRQAEAAKERLDRKGDKVDNVNVDRRVDNVDRRVDGKVNTTAERTRAANDSRPVDPAVRKDKDNNVVDPWVTTKVKTKILAEDLLDKSEINVDTTNDGVVTLKGTVPSLAAESRALELARTTEGVRSVVDRLEVKAPVTR
jgi:osmotically-inducible protein OsmY